MTATIEQMIEQERRDSAAQVVATVMGRKVTRAQLSAAFDRVANRDNWKMPIDATVDLRTHREMLMIAEAVKFFAGCTASFEAVAHIGRRCRYRVQAVGYYAAVGA